MPTTKTNSDEKLIWDEWARITRFLESSRIAFDREKLLLSSLQIKDSKDVTLVTTEGKSTYNVGLEQHLKAIGSHDVLFALVLHSTYALAEAFARLKLGMDDDEELTGGIESWGKNILAKTGHVWADAGGVAGFIEMSVIRNAYAHGVRKVNKKMMSRFTENGHACPWSLGDEVTLDYARIDTYRARLKGLMRLASNKKKEPKLAEPGTKSKPRGHVRAQKK